MNSISYVAYTTVLHVSLGRPNRVRAGSDGVVVTTVEGCFPELWPQPFIQRELFSNACFCRTTGRDFSAWKRREPSFLWCIILSFKLSLNLEWLIVDKLHRTNSSLKQFTKRWSRHLDTALDWSVLVDNAIWILHNNITNTKLPSTLNQRHGFIAVTVPRCYCCQKILAPCVWYTELCYPIMSSSQTHNFFSPLHPSAGRSRQGFPGNVISVCRERGQRIWLHTCLHEQMYLLVISDTWCNEEWHVLNLL